MRKLTKTEKLVKGNYYLVKGNKKKSKVFGRGWFIKVIDVKPSLEKDIIIDEVYIDGGGEVQIHGRNKFSYKEVLKERMAFYELTDDEVEEWKAKITESMI